MHFLLSFHEPMFARQHDINVTLGQHVTRGVDGQKLDQIMAKGGC